MKTLILVTALFIGMLFQGTALANDGMITFQGEIEGSTIYLDNSEPAFVSVDQLKSHMLDSVIANYWSKGISWDKTQEYPRFKGINKNSGNVKVETYE